MLKELYIENYKSLKNTTVQFKDGLNIIIGKNGSGKSNLLEFINNVIGTGVFFNKQDLQNKKFPDLNFGYTFQYLNDIGKKEILTLKLYDDKKINVQSKGIRKVKTIVIIQRKENETKPYFSETYSDESKPHSFNIPNPTSIVENINFSYSVSDFLKVVTHLQRINGLLSLYLRYHLPRELHWLDISNELTVEDSFRLITENKEQVSLNLFSFSFITFLQDRYIKSDVGFDSVEGISTLKNFLFEGFELFKHVIEIADLLRSFSPIEDIRINKNANIYPLSDKILVDNLFFDFKINGEWLPWSFLSDGTKRLFYIISEVLCCNNGIILIEEPELGIHPHQLYKLMQFIKEQSEHKQIIISTHSPLILDTLESDELDRITIAKIENGSSQFVKLTEEQMKDAKEYMEEVNDLSYYWLHSDLESND